MTRPRLFTTTGPEFGGAVVGRTVVVDVGVGVRDVVFVAVTVDVRTEEGKLVAPTTKETGVTELAGALLCREGEDELGTCDVNVACSDGDGNLVMSEMR